MTKEELAKKVDKIHEELVTLDIELRDKIFDLSKKYYKNTISAETETESAIYYDHSTDMDWLLGKADELSNKIDDLRYVTAEDYND